MSDNPFQEPGGDGGGGATLAIGDELLQEARIRAKNAAILGVVALICGVFSQCSSCITLLPGLILGILAITQARQAQAMAPEDQHTSDLSTVGITGGIVTVGFAMLMLTFVALYIGLYVVLFAFVLAIGP